MMSCEKERKDREDAETAARDARDDYNDQRQAAGEADTFAAFNKANILSAGFSGNKAAALWAVIEKSMSALEKQGTAERARAKVPRLLRASERADEQEREAREARSRCEDAHEMKPVEFNLSSTITLRARFLEEKLLPPLGSSGTLPVRQTTHAVEGRSGDFQRLERGLYSTSAVLDDHYSFAASNSTVIDDRGRPQTHTLTEQVTAATPGKLAAEVYYEALDDSVTFWVRVGFDKKPLRSGQAILTVRDPDSGCHTTRAPFSDVPSDWPGVFVALRRKNERFNSGERMFVYKGWTWTTQGDLRVATKRWSTEPKTLVNSASGEVYLLAESSTLEVKLRRRSK